MTFEPPLDRWERRLLWLWSLVTGSAAAGMLIGVFWWWVVFILPIPLVFAAYYAPTTWLYLTPALLAWLALRRRPFAAVSAAVAALAVIAVGVPVLLNARINSVMDAVTRDQTGAPVSLRGVQAVALLNSWGGQFCSFDCERLFITGRAQAVLIGDAGTEPLDLRQTLARLRLVPAGGKPCPALADETHVSARQALRFAPHACVVVDTARLDSANLVVIDRRTPANQVHRRLPTLPIIRHSQEVARFADGRLVVLLRRTRAAGNLVSIPLVLWPYSGADSMVPAMWGKGAAISTGPELPLGLDGLFVESLHVPEFDDPR